MRIIDDEAKTITVKADYYVDTNPFRYKDEHGKIKELKPYSVKDIDEMNSYDEFLNNLNLTVPSGEYEGLRYYLNLCFLMGVT